MLTTIMLENGILVNLLSVIIDVIFQFRMMFLNNRKHEESGITIICFCSIDSVPTLYTPKHSMWQSSEGTERPQRN